MNDLHITRQAEQDFDRLIWGLKKSTKRKASPSWSVPAELLLLALEPDFFSVAEDKLAGFGHAVIDAAEFPFARKELVHILKHAYRSRHVPLIANCSQGFFIGKGNGAAGVGGIRLIHLLCTSVLHYPTMLTSLNLCGLIGRMRI